MATEKRSAVFGIYASRADVEMAVNALVDAEFPSADISVLVPAGAGTRDLAHEKHTKAPEGTTTGVVTGGAVGGALGLLAGIGSLAVPGLGPFLAAGPLVATLAGLGAGGAVGGFIGALVGVGIPEYEAVRYEGRVKAGGLLLSVHCDTAGDVRLAKDILKRTGAQDIASAGEAASPEPESNPISYHPDL